MSEFPQANPLQFHAFGDTFATSSPLSVCHVIVVVLFSDTAPTPQGALGSPTCGVWRRCSGDSSASCGCPGAAIAGDVA